MTETTPWFWIDTDGQPEKPGWYEVLYQGEEEGQQTRLWWSGGSWLYGPDGTTETYFGNHADTGERWRGAATPIGGMYE